MASFKLAFSPKADDAGITVAQKYFWGPFQKQEAAQFFEFCWLDQAHVVMLAEEEIITKEQGRRLLETLLKIAKAGVEGLVVDPKKESILFNIEDTLQKELGADLAGLLHVARSRIDQSATVSRLATRAKFLQVNEKLVNLQTTLINRSAEFQEVVLPYYTHMQHAQPGVLAHYLLAQQQKLQDDVERCTGAYDRLNRNPLGIVGRSGTSWPINRDRTTELMAFDVAIDNSLIGRDTDYAAELISALSIIMAHLNDMATDFHVWFTAEFGFIDLPKGFCAISSVFPQKKNPITLEKIKSVSGPSTTWLAQTLATWRGEGTGDQIIHGVPAVLDTALDTTADMLDLLVEIMQQFTFNSGRALKGLTDGWSTSSNLADELVKKHKISFREAHSIVHALKTLCDDQGYKSADVSPELFQDACANAHTKVLEMSKEELVDALDPVAFVQSRISNGSVGPKEVTRMMKVGEVTIGKNAAWVEDKQKKIKDAYLNLNAAVYDIILPDQPSLLA